jgi:ATP-dependent RNA/DNA helicase IGHMBP2
MLEGRTLATFNRLFFRKILTLTLTLTLHFILGDIVGLYSTTGKRDDDESYPSGVVTGLSSKYLNISLDNTHDTIGQDELFLVVKLANDVTYKRLKSAINHVREAKDFGLLHNFLFDQSTLSPCHQTLSPALLVDSNSQNIRFINDGLNDSQKEAIEFALKQQELAVIHGPPGTGKTTTVVELISQEVRQGHKVLCCAPSNVAVDNLLVKLAKNKLKVVRLGHPARIQAELVKYSLDAILAQSDQKALALDVRDDMDKALAKMKKARNKGERFAMRNEMKLLRKELNEREKRAMKETLSKAEVVLATLTSASGTDGPLRHLVKQHFDLVVIDECSQALEIACWIALLQTKKVVLAGDHLQLPPTILSEEAAGKGLSFTLMERVIEASTDVVRLLNTQYRMHQQIMEWSSTAFYENKLVAAESVRGRLLKDLPNVASNENTSTYTYSILYNNIGVYAWPATLFCRYSTCVN